MRSKLDEELARAVREAPSRGPADENTPPKQFVVSAAGAGDNKRRGNLTLLAVLIAMAAGIVGLVLTSFTDAAVYAKNVDQVVGSRPELAGRRLRVQGTLVHHSLKQADKNPCDFRFKMEQSGKVMSVRYGQCVLPDTFRDVDGMDVAVTVEGTLATQDDQKLAAGEPFEFAASQVLAKCPSKYEMKERQGKGEQMPHQLAPQAPSPAP
jgi:cytochrome c-type biogenesis protein CcmE